jgi:hypothetical protein
MIFGSGRIIGISNAGGGHGMDFGDWLEAERELTRNKGSNKH